MISPNMGAAYGQELAEIYQAAELRILARIAAALAQGIDADDWEVRALGRLQALRFEILTDLQAVNPEAAQRILRALRAAYGEGIASAFADVGSLLPHIQPAPAFRGTLVAVAQDIVDGTSDAANAILRTVDDIYRRTVAQAVSSSLTGAQGRREAAQAAIDTLSKRGLNGVKTRRGSMTLADYVMMAVRTGTTRAALDGHVAANQAMGLDLVTIKPGPRACDICDDWARLILATRGRTGTYYLESATTGKPVTIQVADTLANARSAGFGHPNCRCHLASYIPGVTKPETLQRPPWDAEAYAAQQRQRTIELNIRRNKERAALALTEERAKESRARVEAWQKEMRDHLKRNPELKRQGKREQMINGAGDGLPDHERDILLAARR